MIDNLIAISSAVGMCGLFYLVIFKPLIKWSK